MPAKKNPKYTNRATPTVLSNIDPFAAAQDAILEQADAFGWRLLDYYIAEEIIPMDPPPIGAIVRDLPDSPLVGRLKQQGIPVVRLGSFLHPQDHELPAVLPDIAAPGRLAADHFADRQFRQIAYIGHNPWREHKVTYDEFKKQGEVRGCECFLTQLDDPEGQKFPQKQASARRQRQRRQIIQWLKGLPKPLGLLTYNEYMAARICAWCQQAGLSVPEEIAILGYGNKRYICRVSPVSLSSIEPNEVEYGRQAVCLLKQLIDGVPPPAAPVMIPPKGVVERQSTNILAIPDPVVARALSFLWKHFSKPLSVDEIAAQAGVCRRTLERGFRKHLKRSVNAELQRKRLEQCRKLLKTTDYTLAEIAPQIGFSSGNYLQIAFKKTFGITPRQYRL